MKNKVGVFPGATWRSTHEFGSCLVNHHAKLFFVHIPKCASSWAKQYLSSQGKDADEKLFWDGGNFADPEKNLARSFLKRPIDLDTYTPIFFLRDVQQRWLSHRPCPNVIENAGLDSIEILIQAMPSMIDDEHTAPQSDFIQGLDWNKAACFFCDDWMIQRFSFWLYKNNLRGYQSVGKVNASIRDARYALYRQNWNLLYDYTALKYSFDHLYREDIDLLRETPFF